MGLLFLFLGRLVFIQFFSSDFLVNLAKKQHSYYLEIQPKRGAIFDRNMRPLAVNVVTFSLYAVPPQIKDKDMVASELSRILDLDADFVIERLSRKKQFVWLSRKLDWDLMQKVKALDLDGLFFIKESRRSYPDSTLASQLIGFAGLDNIGLEGLEMEYDSYLKGKSGWTIVLRDAKKRELALSDILQPPVNGFSLVLTIDQMVQYIAEREIEKIFDKYKAKGAVIVVMDVKTGEVLGLANRPTFDLNDPSRYPDDARRNRAVTDYFEPGSVFKIVTAAAALDEGRFSVDDEIFCENGEYKVANHILHDVHPYGKLSFKGVIVNSSNIGTTKIAQELGAKSIYYYARLFGFGSSTSSGMPGEVTGVLKPPDVWSKTSIGAVPIGQEVCVTAIQLAAAISSIANNGVYMKPFVVRSIVDNKGEVIKSFNPELKRRVMSDETAAKLTDILESVVTEGTGKMGASKIFRFAGKTGTAQKIDADGRYSHSKFMASFIGFAPAESPEIAIVVMVDEPRPYYYGGVVCAPAFKAVAEDVLKYMHLSEKEKISEVN